MDPVQQNQTSLPQRDQSPPPTIKALLHNRMLVIFCLIFLFLCGAGSVILHKQLNPPQDKNAPSPSLTSSTNQKPTSLPQTKVHEFTVFKGDLHPQTTMIQFPFSNGENFSYVQPVMNDEYIYLSDKKSVFEYSVARDEKKLIFSVIDNRKVMALSIKDKTLFVSLEPEEYYSENNTFIVKEIDVTSQKIIREIPNLKPTMYGGIQYLFKANEYDIVASFGGDGCGGWGIISRVRNTTIEEIVKTGAGCVDDPRYLGYDEEKGLLFLAATTPADSLTPTRAEAFPDYALSTLYSFNVVTRQTTSYLDLKSYSKLMDVKINEDGTHAALITEKEILLVRLEDKTTTTIPKPSAENTGTEYWNFVGNFLVATDGSNKTLTLIDISSGQPKTISWSALQNTNQNPILLGTWNNTPYFGIYNFNY